MPYDMPVYDVDDERDVRDYGVLILDPISHPPPWVPLFIQLWTGYGQYGKQYGAAMISAPGSKGWLELFKSGSCYLTANRTTEEERKAREPIFRERMARVLRDPWYRLSAKEELKGTLERLAAFDVQKAGDMELASHFFWMRCFPQSRCRSSILPRCMRWGRRISFSARYARRRLELRSRILNSQR